MFLIVGKRDERDAYACKECSATPMRVGTNASQIHGAPNGQRASGGTTCEADVRGGISRDADGMTEAEEVLDKDTFDRDPDE